MPRAAPSFEECSFAFGALGVCSGSGALFRALERTPQPAKGMSNREAARQRQAGRQAVRSSAERGVDLRAGEPARDSVPHLTFPFSLAAWRPGLPVRLSVNISALHSGHSFFLFPAPRGAVWAWRPGAISATRRVVHPIGRLGSRPSSRPGRFFPAFPFDRKGEKRNSPICPRSFFRVA